MFTPGSAVQYCEECLVIWGTSLVLCGIPSFHWRFVQHCGRIPSVLCRDTIQYCGGKQSVLLEDTISRLELVQYAWGTISTVEWYRPVLWTVFSYVDEQPLDKLHPWCWLYPLSALNTLHSIVMVSFSVLMVTSIVLNPLYSTAQTFHGWFWSNARPPPIRL